MTDNELLSLVSEAERQSAIYSGDLMRENTKYLEGYLAEKTGDFSALFQLILLTLSKQICQA